MGYQEGKQSLLTYHLGHTEPWPVKKRLRSSHLEPPPEDKVREGQSVPVKAKLVLAGTKVDVALEAEGIWVTLLAPS
ncbi:hypothetical protein U0070_002188 [Myodes glareolus]|uniref:Uncharacterized protein n=1 Tax=Myodes glareolus TaxID=447135 RepID=A0AAW0JQD1_MYOGA